MYIIPIHAYLCEMLFYLTRKRIVIGSHRARRGYNGYTIKMYCAKRISAANDISLREEY
jgi:hypothetical protein